MRAFAVLLAILVTAALALAQQPGKDTPEGAAPSKPITYENRQYQVRVTGPSGWAKAWEGPESKANWVELVRFEDPRTKASATLACSATNYRSAPEMIESLKKQFEKDSRIAILRREELGATSKRPRGVLFEYTMQGRKGAPVHALAAYYYHLSRRYRVYGTVREAGWRSVSDDFETFAKSLTITSRAFSEDKQNYTDEPQNFSLYFPENWAVRRPADGPYLIFESSRLGVAVRLYITPTQESLDENVARVIEDLESGKAKLSKRGRAETHPALGIPTAQIEYTRVVSGVTFRYRETAIVHRNRFYRLVLVAAESVFKAGVTPYERMVASLSFAE